MKIGPSDNKQVIKYVTQSPDQKSSQEIPKREAKKDKVEISLEGRKKLSEVADKNVEILNKGGEQINSESKKISQIRNRIESGYYDLPDIKDQLLDKLTDFMIDDLG